MPNRLLVDDDGPRDEMVRLNVRIPRWLKNGIATAIAARGKNLNDWCRDTLKDGLARTLHTADDAALQVGAARLKDEKSRPEPPPPALPPSRSGAKNKLGRSRRKAG